MRNLICRFALVVLLGAIARAAPALRDLGYGLEYVRLHELPADLPAKPAERPVPCVVDVRYVTANADAATAFVAWLKFRATPRTPVFILANSETAAALLRPFIGKGRASGVVVVGVPGKNFAPDVAVKATAEEERKAYDAFDRDAPLAKLLTDNPDKVRNDEASLSKDRLAEASADAADALSGKREVFPVDATLQRAVHLHRALVALKRI